jgi:hypothetical protein
MQPNRRAGMHTEWLVRDDTVSPTTAHQQVRTSDDIHIEDIGD